MRRELRTAFRLVRAAPASEWLVLLAMLVLVGILPLLAAILP